MLSYRGLDGVIRRTALSFDPPPAEIADDKALYHCVLAPGQITRIFLSIGCDTTEGSKVPFARALIGAHRERRTATSGMTTVESSNELLNEVLCRSAADLSMLITETPQGSYPYAGIPWYSTTFGRDGIITALQMLWFEPKVARGVLRRLAFLQAKTDDPAADAQPGKILHEMRAGEMAALGEVPFRLYYGTVDATPLFVLLAGAYLDRTGDQRNHRRAVAGDRSGAGLDRPIRRRGRRRLCRIPARHRPAASPIRAGRIRSTRSSAPTAAWSKATSRWPRSRAMSSPPGLRRRVARGAWDCRTALQCWSGRPRNSQGASKRRSGARS